MHSDLFNSCTITRKYLKVTAAVRRHISTFMDELPHPSYSTKPMGVGQMVEQEL